MISSVILRKRKAFEYKLKRQTKSKEDFLEYIQVRRVDGKLMLARHSDDTLLCICLLLCSMKSTFWLWFAKGEGYVT
jgi:hypothetical protein